MYYYIYDSFLGGKKYFPVISRIETRLTDLGINGKINKLSFLKNIEQILIEEIRRGIRTVVIAGNDKTFSQIINLAADLNLTFGLIPIGGHNQIARLLGIPEGERACDILSSRIVEKIDLGQVNNNYFVTSIEASAKNISLECDHNYHLNLENQESIVTINNLGCHYGNNCSPADGQLDVFVENFEKKFLQKKRSHISRLKAKTIKITSGKAIPLFLADEKKIIKTPAEIKILPQKIKIIVGKNRPF